jgi:hypothetical protein
MDAVGEGLLYDGFTTCILVWTNQCKKVEIDKSNPALEAVLAPAKPEDVLELDKVWSFVLKKQTTNNLGYSAMQS